MTISAKTLNWLERCFARALRYFRRKGLSQPDAEDCAAEVRLQLLCCLQRGATLSDGYFLAVVRGCYADFVATQAAHPPTLPLEAVLAGFGTPAADLDGNGTTDDADLLLVLSNFGAEGAPAFAGSVQAPTGSFSTSLTLELSDWAGSAQSVKVQLKPVGSEDDRNVPIFEFTASVGGAPQNVPLTNLPAGIYTVRAFPATPGRWLRAELREPLVVGGAVGAPAAHVPAPVWAEEVIPTDSAPSGGLGPSSASRVNLASGEYENVPPADVSVSNPKGPDVAFVRRYSSYLAKQGYASPGLSLGWVHQYDLRIEGALGSWGVMNLIYPNGARETLTPELAGGSPTGKLIPPAGAPYCGAGTPTNQIGRWDPIVIVQRDNSKWIFRPHTVGTNNRITYRLTNIVDRAGNFIVLAWDTAGRLQTVSRSDGQRLLECEYVEGTLRTVKVYSTAGSVYARVLLEYTNGLLTGVSQVTEGATAPLRWRYRYRTIAGVPLIEVVSTPDPSAGANTLASHAIGYASQGVVQMMVDANGHARTYQYGGVQTSVKVYNRTTGQVDFQWTQKIGDLNVNAGLVDAAQNSSSIAYANHYLPTTYTNREGQTYQIIYDLYGNVREIMTPRGNKIVYTYDYPPDYPCSPVRQITVTQIGENNAVKLPTRYVFYQQTAPVQGVACLLYTS
ncbi:MAG: hypothetical protein N2651_10285, partial [Fimbriimonadales bacterium]|nr:hypothetical protein [Fimbriimonadales bacterium]